MGFPFTRMDRFISGKDGENRFPYYLWIVDRPEGPLWRMMDDSFDEWDRRTGKSVAFFVDPFLKEEWAREFFCAVPTGEKLGASVLAIARQLQVFYRGKLSENLCRHARIGQEFLPAALVSCDWRDSAVVICYLRDAEDMERLFESLIRKASEQAHRIRVHNASQHAGLLSDLSKEGFQVQWISLPGVLYEDLREPIEGAPESIFIERLRQTTRWPGYWLPENDHSRFGRRLVPEQNSFGLSKAYVAMESLDDIVRLAVGFGPVMESLGRLQGNAPDNPDLHRIADYLDAFQSVMEEALRLAGLLRKAVESGDRDGVNKFLDQFNRSRACIGFREEVETRLRRLLGDNTIDAITHISLEAIRASEVYYMLSERVPDFQRDFTAALVGYWKACEEEGRRSIREMIGKGFAPSYQSGKKLCLLTYKEVEKATLGRLAEAFGSLKLSAGDFEKEISTDPLGNVLSRLTREVRNPYTHRKLLTDPEELKKGRTLVGCENPGGALPLLVYVMEEIAGSPATGPTK